MCRSPASNDFARAAPMVLDEASKDVVAVASRSPTQQHRFGLSARPLAVRRPAPALKQTQSRVSREDLDLVRVALERELAEGAPRSDAEIVERVSSSASSRSSKHSLVISIVLCKLREQNAAFFAGYDAKKGGNSTTTTTTTTATTAALEPASASVSTSTMMMTMTSSGDGDGASARPTNSSSSEEDDDDEGCNNNQRNSGEFSSDEDAVVPLSSF